MKLSQLTCFGWCANRMLDRLELVLFLTAATCFGAEDKPAVRRDAPETIRGAVYVSSAAYNAPQMWKNFSLEETRRDFGYAKKIRINALRIWASYEFWHAEPQHFKKAFDQLLEAADQNGIRILIALFENDGVPPTPENQWTTDPARAFAVESPGLDVASPDHQDRWENPRDFVKWFMRNYRNDSRLLAIELMNEPSERSGKAPPTMPFAKSMLATARSMRGAVPLTMGTQSAAIAEKLIPLGLDLIEFHDNFPRSREAFEANLRQTVALARKYDLPAWLTEWQRVRPGGSGFGSEKISLSETTPGYSSLAAAVRKYPVGSFFWSLMVKRAYLPSQRAKGTVNGLFWADGTVWSLADARAIANDPALALVEKKSFPPGFLDYLKTGK